VSEQTSGQPNAMVVIQGTDFHRSVCKGLTLRLTGPRVEAD
jgi:hypothetical protein